MTSIEKSIEEMLADEGFAIHTVQGRSMYPLLKSETDRVLLVAPDKLSVGDVALYKRGEKYVLHRIVRIDGRRFIVRGDNCGFADACLEEKDIIAKLKGYFRGEDLIEDISVKRQYPFAIIWLRDLLKKIYHKVFK